MFARVLFSTLFLLCSSLVAADNHPRVLINTSLGEIVVGLDPDNAPVTVANFLDYVDRGGYDNTIFHRVIPVFMIQGGGRYADLSEAPEGESIRNEADNGLKNLRGTIAMARFDDIDSASRQFFINTADNDNLDHSADSCTREDQVRDAAQRERGLFRPLTCSTFGYAVFGRVESGMEVVDEIELVETQAVDDFYDLPVTPVVILSIERL